MKQKLFWSILALHLVGAYPLALAFFEQPITTAIAWNLFAGALAALFLPWGSISPQRGMGYLVGLFAVVPFALTVGLGYGISLAVDRPLDPSILDSMQRQLTYSFQGFYGQLYFRSVGALIGAYLIAALGMAIAEKGAGSRRHWQTVLAVAAICAGIGVLFHYVDYRIEVSSCAILTDAGNDPTEVQIAVGGKFRSPDENGAFLIAPDGAEYPMVSELNRIDTWLVFAVPPEVAQRGGLRFQVRGFPSVRLPDKLEQVAADKL